MTISSEGFIFWVFPIPPSVKRKKENGFLQWTFIIFKTELSLGQTPAKTGPLNVLKIHKTFTRKEI